MLDVEGIQRKIRVAGVTWEAGYTPLAQLPEEDQDRRLGLEVPPGELERFAAAIAATGYEAGIAFASERDWRKTKGKNWITQIRDQGSCGSCVAFATVATMEAQARIEHKAPGWDLNLAEADLFFCGAGKRCQQGWWPSEALVYTSAKGVPDESCFPYQDHDMDCKGCADRPGKLLKVGEWKELVGVGERKGWLDTNGPTIACMAVYRDFYAYKNGIYRHVSGDLAGYHAVCCVGYSEEERAWICKNSWGTGWGDGGFFKIAYGEAEMDTRFPMWGVSGVTGTLHPRDDESEDEDDETSALADHVVLRHEADGAMRLLARVGGAWKAMNVQPDAAAGLAAAAFGSTAVEVTYEGDAIVTLSSWKKF
ncbi:MAG: C1 family peptidase [Actinomycetota bacterium]|nr:C1 family peptidase [Actinomycetota bacterium]